MNLLKDDFYYELITKEEFGEMFSKYSKEIFEENVDFFLKNVLSDSEKEKLRVLKNYSSGHYNLFMKIICNGEIAGWFCGRQTDEETFKMNNSAVFKQHRRKGIYTALLNKVLELLQEKGFQKVESHHQASNNSVIIPKLKAGFVITGMEIEDKFGLMVKLTYYFNEKRKDVLDFRIGKKRLSKNTGESLNIWLD